MTAADHTLVAAKGRAIADAASLASIDLLQGSWSLRQIDCPALPGHLFVRYRRDQGPGDVSEFTAAIERSGAGSVHAIPILRRSYTTLFEAPASAVAVFNRVQQEEQSPRQPALLGLAQCYAVLAGSTGQPVTGAAWPQGQPSMMRSVGNKKVVQISVPTESATPAAWELTFGNSGMLEKAVSSSLDLGNARKVPPTGEINSHLVPPAAVLETHPVPQGVAPVTHNVPPGSAPVSHPVPQN